MGGRETNLDAIYVTQETNDEENLKQGSEDRDKRKDSRQSLGSRIHKNCRLVLCRKRVNSREKESAKFLAWTSNKIGEKVDSVGFKFECCNSENTHPELRRQLPDGAIALEILITYGAKVLPMMRRKSMEDKDQGNIGIEEVQELETLKELEKE